MINIVGNRSERRGCERTYTATLNPGRPRFRIYQAIYLTVITPSIERQEANFLKLKKKKISKKTASRRPLQTAGKVKVMTFIQATAKSERTNTGIQKGEGTVILLTIESALNEYRNDNYRI